MCRCVDICFDMISIFWISFLSLTLQFRVYLICDENFLEISMFGQLLWAQRLLHLSIPYLHCVKWRTCLIGRLCQLQNFWQWCRQSWWCCLDVLDRWQGRHLWMKCFHQQKYFPKYQWSIHLSKMDQWCLLLPLQLSKMNHWSKHLPSKHLSIHHQVAGFHLQIFAGFHLWSDTVLQKDHEISRLVCATAFLIRGHCKKIIRFNLYN